MKQKRCKCGNFASMDGVCHWCRDRVKDEKARLAKHELEQDIRNRPYAIHINEQGWTADDASLGKVFLELAASPNLRSMVSFSVTRRCLPKEVA